MGTKQLLLAFIMGVGVPSVFLMPTGHVHAASCDLETYLVWAGLGSPTVCDNHVELEAARLTKERLGKNQTVEQVTDNAASTVPPVIEAKSDDNQSESEQAISVETVSLDENLPAIQPSPPIEPLSPEKVNSENEAKYPGRSYFIKGFGALGSQSARADEPGSDVKMGAVVGGVDLYANDWLRLGLIGMYGQLHVDVNDDDEKIDISSFKIGSQFSTEWGNWHLDSLFLYGPEITSASRVVNVSGTDHKLTNDYTNHRVTQAFELGYTERLGSLIVQPIAGVELDWHYQSKASERGHGSSATLIKRSSHWSGETKLGLTFSTVMMVGDIPVVPTLSASWHHRFGKLSNTTTLSFDSGLTYEKTGTALTRDAAELQASLGFHLKPNVVLNMGYTGRYDRFERLHSGSIGFRIDF